jgi:hypothetical protein
MYVQPELRKILVLTTHLRFYYMTNDRHFAAAVNASLVDDPALVLRTMISANRYKKAAEIRRFGVLCHSRSGSAVSHYFACWVSKK